MNLISAMIKTCRGNKLGRSDLKKLQYKRLKKLVLYAKKNSLYFRKLYSDINDDFNLWDLPITNKRDMVNNFDKWVTDSNININRINEFTNDNLNIGKMIDGKYLVFKTSGSTGEPVVVLYDKNNINVASAVAAFRTFARYEDFKKFIKNGKRTAGVFADNGFYLACGMSKYLERKMGDKKNKITIDVNKREDEIVRELNEFKPSMLSGYPANLLLLSNNDKLDISPDVVITGGELLTDDVRKKLKDKFKCYVQTHYSCTEVGEIACECSEGHLHINEDWVIVEAVDKDNRSVGYGKCSDKILITNLANYIQPFIRYEVSDRIIVHDEGCKCGKKTCWLEVEGRTDDILIFENGKLVAPMSLYKILVEIDGVNRFQLIQKSYKKLELRLVADNKDVVFEKVKERLVDFLNSRGIFGVLIYLSEDIPSSDKISGKYKHIYKDFE